MWQKATINKSSISTDVQALFLSQKCTTGVSYFKADIFEVNNQQRNGNKKRKEFPQQ